MQRLLLVLVLTFHLLSVGFSSAENQIQETHPQPKQEKPYRFGYEIQDKDGNIQHRHEQDDGKGTRKGSYGYVDANGVYREVEYVADANGFHVKVKTKHKPDTNKSDLNKPADRTGELSLQNPQTQSTEPKPAHNYRDYNKYQHEVPFAATERPMDGHVYAKAKIFLAAPGAAKPVSYRQDFIFVPLDDGKRNKFYDDKQEVRDNSIGDQLATAAIPSSTEEKFRNIYINGRPGHEQIPNPNVNQIERPIYKDGPASDFSRPNTDYRKQNPRFYENPNIYYADNFESERIHQQKATNTPKNYITIAPYSKFSELASFGSLKEAPPTNQIYYKPIGSTPTPTPYTVVYHPSQPTSNSYSQTTPNYEPTNKKPFDFTENGIYNPYDPRIYESATQSPSPNQHQRQDNHYTEYPSNQIEPYIMPAKSNPKVYPTSNNQADYEKIINYQEEPNVKVHPTQAYPTEPPIHTQNLNPFSYYSQVTPPPVTLILSKNNKNYNNDKELPIYNDISYHKYKHGKLQGPPLGKKHPKMYESQIANPMNTYERSLNERPIPANIQINYLSDYIAVKDEDYNRPKHPMDVNNHRPATSTETIANFKQGIKELVPYLRQHDQHHPYGRPVIKSEAQLDVIADDSPHQKITLLLIDPKKSKYSDLDGGAAVNKHLLIHKPNFQTNFVYKD